MDRVFCYHHFSTVYFLWVRNNNNVHCSFGICFLIFSLRTVLSLRTLETDISSQFGRFIQTHSTKLTFVTATVACYHVRYSDSRFFERNLCICIKKTGIQIYPSIAQPSYQTANRFEIWRAYRVMHWKPFCYPSYHFLLNANKMLLFLTQKSN